MEKYSVNQHTIESIINWVKSGDIAIPEIQRPFVWSNTKVRDLMDSLYQGYPVGYIISWRNPDIKLKNGSLSMGKKVLIDGQQRVTALTTALVGQAVIDDSYNKIVIRIAFHPIEERFEVLNPAIEKDKLWIHDISTIIRPDFSTLQFIKQYREKVPDADEIFIERNIQRLKSIVLRPIGMIELHHELDIETVTEIFIRINSKGVVLSQADFAMSKIAANETYGGNLLRKAIDYFCHLAVKPEFYAHISENDKEFISTEFFNKMKWLKSKNDDLYDPDYNDMLRVAFCYKFKRGKLSDLVSLLSGRNFETRSYEDFIAEDSFKKLKEAVSTFMNETLFKRFIMIVKSAGFVDTKLIRSQNALNFAYVLFLHLKELGTNDTLIERYVRRWMVMSILLGRYSGSPESQFDSDIRTIAESGIEKALGDIEKAYLSDSFWDAGLPQRLMTSSNSTPALHIFWAAQSKLNDKGFLSRDISVKEMIEHRGDIHHIFPKQYLKDNGLSQSQYNQVANFVYVQQEINIKVGKKSPTEYIGQIRQQCIDGKIVYGGIDSLSDLESNLDANCIPINIHEIDLEHYQEFLATRRVMMAQKIKNFYQGL
jgi:hypothetical protein